MEHIKHRQGSLKDVWQTQYNSDTAQYYGNEREVGLACRKSGIERKEFTGDVHEIYRAMEMLIAEGN